MDQNERCERDKGYCRIAIYQLQRRLRTHLPWGHSREIIEIPS